MRVNIKFNVPSTVVMTAFGLSICAALPASSHLIASAADGGRSLTQAGAPVQKTASAQGSAPAQTAAPAQTTAPAETSAPAHSTASAQVAATSPTTTPAQVSTPAKADNLESSLRELHESLRRIKGDVDDTLHEVSRTEEVYNNGVPVGNNPWAQSPTYMVAGGLVAQDALSHAVYLPPRLHWLNNSLAQMLDLRSKLQAETANITKILSSPECNSATRSQGFVLSDITTELGAGIDGLESVIRENPPSNAKINVACHKIAETISGMDRVGDRLWKEAPRGLKSK